MGANRKFTIWQLYFHTSSLHSIFQIWQNYCFLSKINTPSPIRSLHHLNVSLLFDNPPQSPLYLDIFATEGNQSVYKWTKNWGGKLWITPMICLYDLIKNPLKLLFQPFTRVRLERPNTLSVLRLIPHWQRWLRNTGAWKTCNGGNCLNKPAKEIT